MKNKILKFVTTLSIIFLLFFVIFKINYVKADSGWDSSYDSGSSYDSDSSWDYDSESSFSSYSSSSSGGFSIASAIVIEVFVSIHYMTFIFLPVSQSIANKTKKDKKEIFWSLFTIRALLLLILDIISPLFFILDFIMLFILTFKTVPLLISKSNQSNMHYQQISIDEANKIIPDFNIDEFNFKAYEIFYNVQMGWMEFDYDKLKELLTDELYNTYLMDLEALKIKNQKNVMKSFELIETKLVNLREENNQYIAKVILEVKFIDYIEDSNTHKLLRGSNTHKLDNTYELTFVRTKEDKKVDICPSCGAQVNGNVSGICEYCKSKLINNTHDWVLSKKEKISQK
jgi:hypothetical protein